MYIPQTKDKHALIDLARYGTRSRKSIHPDLLVGFPQCPPIYKEGDILDANYVLNLIHNTYREQDDRYVSLKDIVQYNRELALRELQEVVDSLGDLAHKDTASTEYTPQGVNSQSAVTLNGGKKSNLVTTSIVGTNGTDTVHDTPTLNKEQIGSASDWNAGSMFSLSYNDDDESITFIAGQIPTLTITEKQVGTSITEGVEKIFAKKANENTIVATGEVNDNGTGATVVTELHTDGIADSQIFSGELATIVVS